MITHDWEREEFDNRISNIEWRKKMFKNDCQELRDTMRLLPQRPAWADECLKELNDIEILVKQQTALVLERLQECKEAFEEMPRIYEAAG